MDIDSLITPPPSNNNEVTLDFSKLSLNNKQVKDVIKNPKYKNINSSQFY